MYKLLVVDDEPIIADGISEIFKDMRNPEIDVYTAYSGSSALEYIRENKINILLTDICMPQVDGFTLQKEIIKIQPNCKVIFLTGYNDFAYIQSAMRNDSADYILKTEDEQVIVKSVLKAINKIEEENNNKYAIKKAHENLKRAIPIIQKEFMYELLDGWKYSNEELERNFIELDINLKSSEPVILVVGRIDYYPYGGLVPQRMKTIFNVQDVVQQLLGGEIRCISVLYEHYKMIWLLQPATEHVKESLHHEGAWNLYIQSIYEILESAQKKCIELFHAPVSFILSNMPIRWNDLTSIYRLLDFNLNYMFKFSKQILLIHDNDSKKDVGHSKDSDATRIRNSVKMIDYLSTLLEYGQEERYNSLFNQIIDAVNSVEDNSKYKNEVYYSLATMFFSYINRSNIDLSLKQEMELDKLFKMDMHSSWEEAVSFFKKISSKIFKLERDQNAQNGENLVFQVQEYITKNIGKDITLTQLSSVFHFNASYFSRLYKSLTGENITDFMKRVRLEKAKDLLKNPDLKVNEIAERLGFKTPSYFTNFFKTNTNMTPQKYRQIICK